jgi:hypothetical protein
MVVMQKVPMAQIKIARVEIEKRLRTPRHLAYCLCFFASFVHV